MPGKAPVDRVGGPQEEPGKAPVDRVGGPQEDGPWPEHVEEIVEGDTHERMLPTEAGRVAVQATVTNVSEDDGGGHVVSFTAPNPDVSE